jgi:hypothetical protein
MCFKVMAKTGGGNGRKVGGSGRRLKKMSYWDISEFVPLPNQEGWDGQCMYHYGIEKKFIQGVNGDY